MPERLMPVQTDRFLNSIGPEVIKVCTRSTQLCMKFSLPIYMKMPTIVGIFIFISRKVSCSAMFSKENLAAVSMF